ncbi:M48 family metalloprotease [Nocardia sp. NPDC051570]|uniref:M48 family metalloprotease n=1 Tax=Nocardia sp. NPDC051570 TaxID=3364324 RepID=UPI00379CBDB1
MTSEVIATANHPGGLACARRSAADRVRAWIVMLLSAVPSAALMSVLLFGLGLMLGIGFPAALPTGWFLLCALWGALCFRSGQQRWALRLFGVRQPMYEERLTLVTAWENVARKAGVPAAAYSLWIPEADRAFAVPDAMITVSADTLRRTSPRELEAVLAHQLGQRVQGRTAFWRFVFRHHNLPVVWVERALMPSITVFGDAIARRLPAPGSRMFSGGWNTLGRVLVACPVVAATTVIVGPAAVLLRVLPELAALALMPLTARAEYRADQLATDLGYGTELGAILRRPDMPPPAFIPPTPLSVSAWTPKPAPDNRIRHIRDRLDELARRWQPA